MFLGTVTFFLWRATKRAMTETADGLNIARRSADTAEKVAMTVLEQTEIARAAFLVTNRPWLVVEAVEATRTPPERPTFTYDIVNYGISPAFVINITEAVIRPGHRVTQDDVETRLPREAGGAPIAVGGRRRCTAEPDADWPEPTGGSGVHAIRKIIYEGVNNLRCETGFCWEYDSGRREFREAVNRIDLNHRR